MIDPHYIRMLQSQGTILERAHQSGLVGSGAPNPNPGSNIVPPRTASRNTPSPSISPRSSLDGSFTGSGSVYGGAMGQDRCGSRKRRSNELIPDWVKVENIEDFKRLCEVHCQDDSEIKEMVEQRRKVKNRISAKNTRQKRIEVTCKLKTENDELNIIYVRTRSDLDKIQRENLEINRRIQLKDMEREQWLSKRARMCQQRP